MTKFVTAVAWTRWGLERWAEDLNYWTSQGWEVKDWAFEAKFLRTVLVAELTKSDVTVGGTAVD